MPATNKVGTQLLLSPHIRDRARALAIVRHEAVAEIYRAALEGGGLRELEAEHRKELDTLKVALSGMKIDFSWAVEDMIKRKLWLNDLMLEEGRPRGRYPKATA